MGDDVKAAVVERYGPPEVVSVVDVPDPVAGKGQLLVRVHATTLNSGDARIRGCRLPPGLRACRAGWRWASAVRGGPSWESPTPAWSRRWARA